MSESMFGMPVQRDSGARVAVVALLLIVAAAVLARWNAQGTDTNAIAAFAAIAFALAWVSARALRSVSASAPNDRP